MVSPQEADFNKRVAALSPEKRALFYQILQSAELVVATDLLGTTNHRAEWADFVAEQLRKTR